MKNITLWITSIVTTLILVMIGVSSIMGPVQSQDADDRSRERDEHQSAGEDGEDESGENGSDAGGEETNAALAPSEEYDEVRGGARLILAYDAASNSFIGTVENTTDAILQRVRVEVHLSNGLELGPTVPLDLAPGEIKSVMLSVFESWSAHAEVGMSEANHGADSANGEESCETGEGDGRGEHGNKEGDGD